jgi:hypothetical protein
MVKERDGNGNNNKPTKVNDGKKRNGRGPTSHTKTTNTNLSTFLAYGLQVEFGTAATRKDFAILLRVGRISDVGAVRMLFRSCTGSNQSLQCVRVNFWREKKAKFTFDPRLLESRIVFKIRNHIAHRHPYTSDSTK